MSFSSDKGDMESNFKNEIKSSVKFLPITDEDNDDLWKIVDAHEELFGDTEGEFYKIEYNGTIYYLNRNDKVFTLYDLEGDTLTYEEFFIDEDYQVVSILLENYGAFLAKDYMKFIDTRGYWCFINLNEKDHFLTFTQVSPNNKLAIGMVYPVFEKNVKLFPLKNRKPSRFLVKKTGRPLKTYSLVEGEEGTLLYDIAVIKEFGLQSFLEDGSYSLVKEKYVSRYIRFYGKGKNISLFPLCHLYKEEDMYALLAKEGFYTSIPEEILSFYNAFSEESIAPYVAIAHVFKEMNQEKGIFLSFQKKNKE